MEQATVATRGTGSEEAAAFVERFADAWANPELERFAALFHQEIVLEQPMIPRTEGKQAAVEGFRRLHRGFPGLHGDVLSWSGGGDLVFIELRLKTTGNRSVEWTVTDRIRLVDGLIRERISYFDSMPLILAVLTRPSLWPGLLRVQLSR